MVYNQGAFRILSSIAFETVKTKPKDKQKSMISRKHFSFSIYSGFWRFRNRFWYQLKKVFLINYQHLKC